MLQCSIIFVFTAHRKEFSKHRKEHYNEAENIKLARALIAKELAELEDDGEPTSSTFAESAHSPSVEQQVSLLHLGLAGLRGGPLEWPLMG